MTERMNMLRIETPGHEASPTFDARVDVRPEDIQEMRKQYEQEYSDKRHDKAVDMAQQMQILGLHQCVSAPPDLVLQIRSMLSEYRRAGDWYAYARWASKVRIAFPGIDDATPPEWDEMGRDIQRFRNPFSPNPASHLEYAYYMHILFPDKPIPMSADDKQRLDEHLRLVQLGRNPGYYASLLAKRRILFPEQPYEVTRDDWEIFRKERGNTDLKGPDFIFLARLMANMHILAADEVRITDKGLEIVLPAGNAHDKTPPQPLSPEM